VAIPFDETRKDTQCLNVSWAVHPEVIARFLKERAVEFGQEG
jgi:hypothetical protein